MHPKKEENLNQFIDQASSMYDQFLYLSEEVDLLLYSFDVSNIDLAKYLQISRLSVGRKRKQKFWKPDELKQIAEYLKQFINS